MYRSADNRETWTWLLDERDLINRLVNLLEGRQRLAEMTSLRRRTTARPLNLQRSRPRRLGATEAEIENATEMVRVSDLRENDETTLICPILRSELADNTEVMRIRECGHYATTESMRRWLSEQGTCPVCRARISSSSSESPSTDPLNIVDQLSRMIAGDITGTRTQNGGGQTVFEYHMNLPST